ncbi:MAG: sensor histidine kinase [Blautia sp.]
MFAPVEESYQKQKRFITDAGHELKTLLTIIDANVEVLEMEHGENEWTRSIRNQTRRLSGLTADLVTLSRLDEGGLEALRVDFSLSDAAEEVLENIMAPALASGRKLSWEITPNLSMCGDEKQIRQLLSLLMDNAVKYSDEHGTIEVCVKKRGRGRQIVVTNTVSEMPSGNLNALFERFTRADASRSFQTAGYGIGLSIARAIVLAHKGKIKAKSGDGKSFTITTFFP